MVEADGQWHLHEGGKDLFKVLPGPIRVEGDLRFPYGCIQTLLNDLIADTRCTRRQPIADDLVCDWPFFRVESFEVVNE